MGFYGNITNTARTQFQFDLIYPNRTEMLKNQSSDGVYIGRYILIEYDTETNVHNFDRVYIYNNKLYTSANHESSTLVTKSAYDKGDIVYTAEDTDMSTGYPLSKCAFYVITSNKTNSSSAATYEEIVSAGTKSNYTYNYNIDMSKGEEGRGYDSTVWQKTYINGSEKYVMIAELNSVVPTFNIVADPPMMAPITPHFDIESTDIYYKLHWQTPWGFRVAEANGTNVTSTTNNKAQLPSDGKTTYTINKYNEDTGVNTTETSSEYNAAIYYNAAGFKPEKRTRSSYKDDISIKPTGKSGNEYNLHTGGASNMGVQPDIMEFSFILPSLGNTISDIWDIVYGENRNRDIEWKDALAPDESDESGGMTRELTTFAGCINKVHDLMGMIITDKSEASLNKEWYNKKYLYQEDDKYYRIAAIQTYTYPDGATVGTESTIDYKFVEVPDMAGKLSTIYGCILQMRELLGTELAADTKDRNTAQGSINVLNDLIDLFEHKINSSCPVITNSKGQLSTATWTTAQIGEAINKGTGDVTNFDTVENQWISYSIDGDNKQISIYHTSHSVDNTVTTKDVNNNGDTIITYMPIVDNMGHIVGWNTETTTLPFGYKNVIIGDESTAVIDIIEQENTLTANNTQDSITFKPSNKWIKIQGDDKTVTISHEVHSFSNGEANTEYGLTADKFIAELDKNNTFEVPVFKFDEAGHITGARTHTIAIPLPSMDDITATNASVLTGISMVDNTGKITPTYGNAGERLLTGYEIGTNSDKVAKTDSINKAFGKVQVQLDNEITNRANTVNAEKERAETAESSLQTAIDNEARTARAAEETLTNNLATEVSNRIDTVNAEKERAEKVEADLNTAITNEIAARSEAIINAINELDADIVGGAENEYISSVKEVDGKIVATKETLPDYSDYWNKISTLENELIKANETIEQLTVDLTVANNTITDILERLTKLEAPTEEPVPDPEPES